MSTVLVVGASSGIGLELARRLVDRGATVIGVARRESELAHDRYHHVIADVCAPGYREALVAAIDARSVDVCVYTAGIGKELVLPEVYIPETDPKLSMVPVAGG